MIHIHPPKRRARPKSGKYGTRGGWWWFNQKVFVAIFGVRKKSFLKTQFGNFSVRGAVKKCFFGESFPKCVNPPTLPRILWDSANKGKIRVKKGDFRGDFGPGVRVCHPTHPYLGKRYIWNEKERCARRSFMKN